MKNKNLIIIIISIVVLILIGIGIYLIYPKLIPAEKVSLNETFKLESRKRALVNDKLEIILVNASDGRCKNGWKCIWQGEISYTIMVNNKKIELGTVRTKSVDYDNYTITLDDDNDSTKYVRLKVEEKKR